MTHFTDEVVIALGELLAPCDECHRMGNVYDFEDCRECGTEDMCASCRAAHYGEDGRCSIVFEIDSWP